MPVFTLKNYEASKDTAVSDSDAQVRQEAQDLKEQVVTIQANDSVAKIVAAALYKTLPNVDEGDTQASVDTQVISTEDINRSPADTWELVKNTRNIVIVNEGFSTQKEEWFLSNLECSKANVFYSVESYLRSLNQQCA